MYIKLLKGESIKYGSDANVNLEYDASGNITKIEIDGNIEIEEEGTYLFTESENEPFEEVPSFYVFNLSDNIYYTLPTISSTNSSGDPHIDPIFGDSYELLDDPHVYRMIQGDNFVMNAETRKITTEEKQRIKHYYQSKTNKNDTNELYLHGCFYSKLYIKSENKHIMIDIQNTQVHVGTTSGAYFTIHKLADIEHTFGSYKYNKIESGIICEFRHGVYGKLQLYVFYYENPQINNGFHMQLKYDESMHGLLVRESNIHHYLLKSLTDVRKLMKSSTGKHHKRSILQTIRK